jgi:hypothetical protein
MSSRHETEKRLRPRNDPYKRNHFNQSQYLRVTPISHSVESVAGDSTGLGQDLEYDNDDDYES